MRLDALYKSHLLLLLVASKFACFWLAQHFHETVNSCHSYWNLSIGYYDQHVVTAKEDDRRPTVIDGWLIAIEQEVPYNTKEMASWMFDSKKENFLVSQQCSNIKKRRSSEARPSLLNVTALLICSKYTLSSRPWALPMRGIYPIQTQELCYVITSVSNLKFSNFEITATFGD